MKADLETDEPQPEIAAFHHGSDMTETVRFLVRFFIGLCVVAAVLITGAILGIAWLVNRG